MPVDVSDDDRQYCIDLGLGRTDLFLQWPLSEQGYTGAL
jgi:hypothetical protein